MESDQRLPAKKCVGLTVKPGRWGEGDEELTPVGVRPTVGHAQDTSSSMFKGLLNLILEIGAAGQWGEGKRLKSMTNWEKQQDLVLFFVFNYP